MARQMRLTAIIEREDDGFVSLCPELDIASQVRRLKRPKRTWSGRLLCSSRLRTHPKLPGASTARFLSRRLRCRLGRLRVISGLEVCRILEENGFVEVRQHGSHRIMQKGLKIQRVGTGR